MAGSTLSRRLSEFFGVALFGAALIWLVALATYDPTDPVWFFSAGAAGHPSNFAGRVGAFLAEMSFQVVGYASYLIPAAMVMGGGGGGEGEQDEGQSGSGGGFGLRARPVGAYVVRDDQVTWQPAFDLNRVILGGQLVAVAALFVIRSILRRRS